MKKYLNFKTIFYILQAVAVMLIAVGVLPRYYAFFVAGAVLIYMAFLDFSDALAFAIALIPFYIALPISKTFDTLIYWRILFIELFLFLILRKREEIKKYFKDFKDNFNKKTFKDFCAEHKSEIGIFVILLLATLSLIGAPDAGVGIKRVGYYFNIFILYFILSYGINSIEDVKKILKSLAVAGAVFAGIGATQLFILYGAEYHKFWQFWASKIIPAFYGQKLGQILSFNNTWFAYSQTESVSLRIFSLFPTSLAFAMSMIMLSVIPFSLYYFKENSETKKIWMWISLALLMMGVILSGSRGAWLSIGFAVLLILVVASLKKTEREDRNIYIKNILLMFLLFSLAFPLSPIILRTNDMGTSSVGRIWTIKDTDEISNKTRIDIWRVSWESIKKHPILGTGISNFSAEYEKFGQKWKTTSHNLVLYVATEIGLPAAILGLILCFFLIKDLIMEFFYADSKFLKIFFLSSAVAFVWVLGYSLTIDELLNADKATLIFVSLIGILYAARRIQKQKRSALGIDSGDVVQ